MSSSLRTRRSHRVQITDIHSFIGKTPKRCENGCISNPLTHTAMTNLAYHTLIQTSNTPSVIRQKMVERYYELGRNASAVAREYRVKRQTVTKWVARFEQHGVKGLTNRSRARHTLSAHKSPPAVEEAIVALARDRRYRIGQDRIRLELSPKLRRSTSVINRIMHEHYLIKKRRKKYQKKRQCAAYHKTLRALKHWQVDVKELRDIPNVTALITAGIIPNFQYTARDQVTGTTYVCYAWEHSLINAVRFVALLFEHLKGYGIHPGDCVVQTDNGSEFIGSIHAKERSLFTTTIEDTYRATHRTIPVGKKEYQGVVESLHGRIEYEFYDIEMFASLADFLAKAYTYTLYWNLNRKKLSTRKTPYRHIKETCRIFATSVGDFKPIMLDSLTTYSHHYALQSVPYVGDEVNLNKSML